MKQPTWVPAITRRSGSNGSDCWMGVEPLLLIWTTAEEKPDLALQVVDDGLRAILTSVDPKQLDKRFVGREFDVDLLAELPAGVDACGERGEFHTFCYRCPQFRTEMLANVGDTLQ
jgi:diphthamide synthase (EF-2-diphthine--ammonia ligase)